MVALPIKTQRIIRLTLKLIQETNLEAVASEKHVFDRTLSFVTNYFLDRFESLAVACIVRKRTFSNRFIQSTHCRIVRDKFVLMEIDEGFAVGLCVAFERRNAIVEDLFVHCTRTDFEH